MGQSRGFVLVASDLRILTTERTTGGAELTMTAENRQAGNDMIAGFYVAHLRAHFFHHAGGLMTENAGERCSVKTIDVMKVAVTDTDRGRSDQHFMRFGVIDLYLFDTEWLLDGT